MNDEVMRKAVGWIRKGDLSWAKSGVANGIAQFSFVERDGVDGYVIPLYEQSQEYTNAYTISKIDECNRLNEELAALKSQAPIIPEGEKEYFCTKLTIETDCVINGIPIKAGTVINYGNHAAPELEPKPHD